MIEDYIYSLLSHLQNCVYEWDFLSPCQARGRLWG